MFRLSCSAQGRQAAAGPVQSSLRSRPTQSSPQTVQEHTIFTLRAVPSLYRSGGGLARSLGTVGGIHSKLSEVVLFDCACRLDQNTWASEYEVDWSSNFGFGGSEESRICLRLCALSSAHRSLDFGSSSEAKLSLTPACYSLVTWALPPIAAAGSRAGTRILVCRRKFASGTVVGETWGRALSRDLPCANLLSSTL